MTTVSGCKGAIPVQPVRTAKKGVAIYPPVVGAIPTQVIAPDEYICATAILVDEHQNVIVDGLGNAEDTLATPLDFAIDELKQYGEVSTHLDNVDNWSLFLFPNLSIQETGKYYIRIEFAKGLKNVPLIEYLSATIQVLAVVDTRLITILDETQRHKLSMCFPASCSYIPRFPLKFVLIRLPIQVIAQRPSLKPCKRVRPNGVPIKGSAPTEAKS